jgi:hypothetical protein
VLLLRFNQQGRLIIKGGIKMQTITQKLFSRKALFIGIFIMMFATLCFAQNPIITNIYTADPSAHVWADGRIYVYASHDIEPNRGCDLMDKYHVYSSADMVNWVDHGEILSASQVPWGRPEGGFMWAPDCAYKNGTYYFYFPHPSGTDWGSTWKIGIATSTSPASGFTCQGYIPGLESLIDPCVFQDDDGQDYFYYGGGGVCKGGKLNADMISINGSMQTMTGLVDFHEATWVHKRNGIYYLSYADNHSDGTGDNRMCYATSTNPLGPWTYKGVYMDPTDSYCDHGSIVQYKGQWYAFYFNSSISHNDWLRSTCVDYLYYNADGTIQKVIQTTAGVGPAGPTTTPAPTPTPTPTSTPGPTAMGGVLDKCDSTSGWTSNNTLSLNTSDKKEGTGSLQSVGSGTDEFAKAFGTAVNSGVTAANGYLQFWYYVSDVTKFNAENQVELGSAGKADTNEYGWSLTGLVNGWNFINLKISNAGISGGTPNLSAINWFRIYHFKNGSLTTKIDEIRFSSTGATPTPGGATPTPTPTATPVPGATKYEAESGTVGNGAIIANDSAASGGQCIQNLHLANSYFQIGNVNGGSGGSKTLHIIYAENGTGTITVYVNGTSAGTISCPTTGGWSTFTGNVQKTITLNSGTGNTIKIVGGSGGINADYITVQ